METNISLIIVNWNTTEKLEALLQKLGSHKAIDITVVDNNSRDKPRPLEKSFPHVSFIFNERNKGYAAACNQGAINAKGEWLFFLNPDVVIDGEGVQNCVREAIEKNYDAACPKSSKNGYQKPVPSFLSLFIELSPLHRFIPESLFSKKTLFGGALLIKRNVFNELKGWDERFFVWFEDSDLTKRIIIRKARFGLLSVNIAHHGGASFEHLSEQTRFAYFFQSLNIYLRKHHGIVAQKIIRLIAQRFWMGHLYPETHKGVSMIIPNMRIDLLESFLKENKEYMNAVAEWIVVSSSLDMIHIWKFREKFPDVRFIPIDKNRGFAATVDIGMRAATGAYIGTCNDDVVLNDRSFNFMKELPKDAGSVNPIIHARDGSVESAGILVLPKGKAVPIKIASDQTFQEVDATNGACVLYNRSALAAVGLFDERFGSYLEDIDLSLRMSRAGYGNYVHNASHVAHLQHQTSKGLGIQKQWWDFKNWILVIAKNWSLSSLIIHAPQILLERLRNLYGIIKAV